MNFYWIFLLLLYYGGVVCGYQATLLNFLPAKSLKFKNVVDLAQTTEVVKTPFSERKVDSKEYEWQQPAICYLTGVITSTIILFCQHGIIMLDKKARSVYPWQTPLIASLLIGLLHVIEPKVSIPVVSNINNISSIYMKTLLLRIIGFIISIGGGLTLGLAGPAAEIGTAVACILRQYLIPNSDPQKFQAVALSGSAAGFATNFNTPFSGFAFSAAVTAKSAKTNKKDNINEFFMAISVIAAMIIVRKNQIFQLPTVRILAPRLSLTDLPSTVFQVMSLAGLGFFSATVMTIFQRSKAAVVRIYEKFKVPVSLRPILAGFVCMIAAYQSFPQTVSSGFLATNKILEGKSSFQQIAKFLLAKISSLIICTSSNIIGGIFAPIFFVGVGTGGVYSHLLERLLTSFSIAFKKPDYFTIFPILAGASTLACQYSSVMLPIIVLLEMTQSIQLLLPIMITTVIAQYAYRLLNKN